MNQTKQQKRQAAINYLSEICECHFAEKRLYPFEIGGHADSAKDYSLINDLQALERTFANHVSERLNNISDNMVMEIWQSVENIEEYIIT